MSDPPDPTTIDGYLYLDPQDAASRGVRFERDYATSATDLWSALTEPERVARWLSPLRGDLRPGGRFKIHFDDGDAEFEVASCAAPTTLVVHWLHAPQRVSVVSVEISDLGDDRTRLVLDHRELTVAQAPEYAAGWQIHLSCLATVFGAADGDDWSTFSQVERAYRAAAADLTG